MYEEIKSTFPPLKDQDDFIKVVLEIRQTFSADKIPFKITIGESHIGNIDNYLNEQKRLRTKKAPIKRRFKGK